MEMRDVGQAMFTRAGSASASPPACIDADADIRDASSVWPSPASADGTLASPVRSGRTWKTMAVIAIYLAIAFLLFEKVWSTNPNTFIQAGGDQYNFTWFLGWVAWAITHFHNPLFSNYVNYPYGVNLVTNAGVVGLGTLFAPITLLSGPIASFNTVETLALAGSAISGYFFALRFVKWRPAAFFAGLLFGFSPYEIGQSAGHINLTFLVLPPLILLMLHEIVIRQRWSAWSGGLVMGLLVVGQFFISTEILFDTILIGAVGVLTVLIIGHRSLMIRFAHAMIALVWSAAIAVILLAYPLWFALRGPGHISGPIQLVPQAYRADLAGLVVPDSRMLFAPHHLALIANNFANSSTENGSYLGIVLVVALGVGTLLLWKSNVIKVAVISGAIAFILSLGNGLVIKSAPSASDSGFPLPERLIAKLPLLDNAIPARFAMLTVLFSALVLAVMVTRIHDGLAPWVAGKANGIGRVAVAQGVPVLFAAACLVPLIPASFSPSISASGTPSFFTSRQLDTIPSGAGVLVYPYSSSLYPNPTMWQAVGQFHFRQPGGTMLVPNGTNSQIAFSFSIGYTRSNIVATTLIRMEHGMTATEGPGLRDALREELGNWHVSNVLAFPAGTPDPSGTVAFLTWLVGKSPVGVRGGGGGYLWENVHF